MELFAMQYVVNVAEAGNFSLAAQECHVGQPALSQQIAKLERELGVSLFSRNPRGAVLTEAGAEFVRRAREILKSSEELSAQMALYAGLHKGNLVLGLITSLQCIEFGEMLAAFVRSYPDISISIRQFGSHQLLELLSERKLDLAFINRPMQPLSSSIAFAPLGTDHYCLAVPLEHPLANRKRVSIRELKNERFIFHQPWQVASDLVMRACNEAGFSPNIVCRSGTPSTSLYMVQGGMGVALFPSEEFQNRKLMDIRCVELEERIMKEVGVAWRKDAESPLIRTMVHFAGEWARNIA